MVQVEYALLPLSAYHSGLSRHSSSQALSVNCECRPGMEILNLIGVSHGLDHHQILSDGSGSRARL